jgi:hypothetical protein
METGTRVVVSEQWGRAPWTLGRCGVVVEDVGPDDGSVRVELDRFVASQKHSTTFYFPPGCLTVLA